MNEWTPREAGSGRGAEPGRSADAPHAPHGPYVAAVLRDLNDAIATIGGSAATMLAGLAPHDPARTHAQRILEISDRAEQLTSALSDGAPPAPRPTNARVALGPALRDGLNLARPLVPARIALGCEIAPDLPMARGAALDAVQLAFALVLSARNAVRGAGAIELSVAAGPVAPSPEPALGRVVPGRAYAVLRTVVRGAAAGAWSAEAALAETSDAARPREGVGTGGLAGVEETVRRLGGAVRGLPRDEGQAVEVLWPLAPSGPDLSGHSVMVMPDPRRNVAGLCDALEAVGAEVSLCFDEDEAVASVVEDMGAWDVAVLASPAAAARLREADAGLPVVLLSGEDAHGHSLPAGVPEAVRMIAELVGEPCAS